MHKPFIVHTNRRKRFATLEAAKAYCEHVWRTKGILVALTFEGK